MIKHLNEEDIVKIAVGVNSPDQIMRLGHQLLLELYGIDPKLLNNLKFIVKNFKKAAKQAKAKIVKSAFHKFQPHGVSGVLVISASHMAVHTWPEYGYASVEIYFCGNEGDIQIAISVICEAFQPKNCAASLVCRGIPEQFFPANVPFVTDYLPTNKGFINWVKRILTAAA